MGMGGLGDLADGIKQGIADGVNATAEGVGQSLDVVGLNSAGEKVRDGAEYLTGAAGAVVPERDLGETDEPGELIHGSTGDLAETVQHLRAFASAFENTGQALRGLDPDHWTGTAAASFRDSFTTHPKRWLTAADACTAAADALAEYAETVSWARGQAAEAIEKWRAAEARSATARKKYDQQVWEYESARAVGSLLDSGGEAPTDPGQFADPGTAGRERAREILEDARRVRDSAAETATAKVTRAFEAAPAEPSTWSKFKAGLMDGTNAANMELEHFAGGFVKGGTGLLRMVRTVNPMDPYNLTHPSQYLQNVSVTGMGLLTAANHPVRTAKSLAGSGWSSDPSEALGTLSFDFVLDALTGGAAAGVGAARRTATGIAKEAAETGGERGAREAAGNAGESAAATAAESGPSFEDFFLKDRPAAETADAMSDAARGKWADWDNLPNHAKHESAMAEISNDAVTFDGNAGAVRYGGQHWNDYVDNLPADQQAAVRDYTGTEFSRVNGYLRDGDFDTEAVRRHIADLDKALAGNPLPHDVVVSRGTNLEHYLRDMGVDDPSKMAGRTFKDDAYMSTSLGDVASGFDHKQAVLHLRVTEGTPGLWVEKLTHAVGERELLLGRGRAYEITKVFQDDAGKWQVYGVMN